MRLTAPIPGMLLIALFAAPAVAHGDWTHCGRDDVEIGSSYYLVAEGTSGPWIWLEVNGIAHLQLETPTCPEASTADVMPDIFIF